VLGAPTATLQKQEIVMQAMKVRYGIICIPVANVKVRGAPLLARPA